MFWFLCRKIGLFPAILHRKMFSASLQRVTASHDFYLILLKTNVSVYFRVKLRCFQDSCLEEQPLPFFVHKLRC